MTVSVHYVFSAAGMDSVNSAFRTIDQSSKHSGRAMEVLSNQGAKNFKALYREQRREAIRAANDAAKIEKQAQQKRLRQEKENLRHIAQLKKKNLDFVRGEEAKINSAVKAIGFGALGVGIGAITGLVASIKNVASKAFDLTKQATGESIDLQDRAINLAIQGGSSSGRMDPTKIRKHAEDVAQDVKGQRASGVLGAMGAFVTKTGDMEKALSFSQVFAEVAQATNTDIEAIGSAAADIFKKFDVKTAEDMSKTFAVLAVQGKRGNFELSELASLLPEMGAAARVYGLQGTKGITTLGGLAQIARESSGSSEEATTAIRNMFVQLTKKSDLLASPQKLKAEFGIENAKATQVFTDKTKTKTRDIVDVLTETIANTGGNIEAFNSIFDMRGSKAVAGLVTKFNDTRQKTVGTEAEKTAAGLAAMRRMIEEATAAQGAEKEIREDLALSQKKTAASLTVAWENFVGKVGESIAPAVAEIIEAFAPLVDDIDFASVGEDIITLGEAAKSAAEFFDLFAKEDPNRTIRRAERQESRLQARLAPYTEALDGVHGDGARARAKLGDKKYTEYVALRKELAAVQGEKAIAQNKLDRGAEAEMKLQELGISGRSARDITGRIYKDQDAAKLSTWENFKQAAAVAPTGLGAGAGLVFDLLKGNKPGSSFANWLGVDKEQEIRNQLASNIKSDTREINKETAAAGQSLDVDKTKSDLDSVGDAASKAASELKKLSGFDLASVFAGFGL